MTAAAVPVASPRGAHLERFGLGALHAVARDRDELASASCLVEIAK